MHRLTDLLRLETDLELRSQIKYECEVDRLSIKSILLKHNFNCGRISLSKIMREFTNIDRSRTIRTRFNENYFSKIDHQNKAYWLGYLAADGCVSKNNNNISLSSRDKIIIDKFIEDLDIKRLLNQKFYKGGMVYKMSLHSLIMKKDLNDNNITPKKSLSLKPPENLPKEMIRHWIRGYFDGDGSAHLSKRRPTQLRLTASFIGTKSIIEWIRSNLPVSDNRTISKRDNSFYIRTSKTNQIIDIYHYFYDDSIRFLPRKKLKFEEFIQFKIH